MKWLAFDTSSDILSVALAEEKDGQFDIKANISLKAKNQHGQTLAPTINNLLMDLAWQPSDIQALVVGIGPGSYTGLRIALTFAKVWAKSKGIPLYTVSSLGLMAASRPSLPSDSLLMPIMDARRQTAYTALYHNNHGQVKSIQADRHIAFEEWLSLIAGDVEKATAIYLVGQKIDDFATMTRESFPAKTIHVLDQWEANPHVERAFAHLNLSLVEDIDLLVPNYGHATLAEQEWADRQRQAGQEVEEKNEDLIDHFN